MQIEVHSQWQTASKQLSLSPRGPGAFALSQTPSIDSACVKQLSCSIVTTIPVSLIFLSVVFSAIQGISRSFDLQSVLHLFPKTLVQPHRGVRSVFSARMADKF